MCKIKNLRIHNIVFSVCLPSSLSSSCLPVLLVRLSIMSTCASVRLAVRLVYTARDAIQTRAIWGDSVKKSEKKVYSFIKSQVTDRTCLQSKYKLYEIRPTGTARRLATQWVREQPCKKINRKRKLQLNTVSLLRWRHICHESFRCWWESIPGSLTWEAR